MRVLVCSRADPASVNVRDRLLELGGWEESGRSFRGRPVHARSEAILVEVEGPSIHDESLDGELAATGLPVRDVWFLSKHAAASGTASLTVHPIGNPGEARFGGRAGHFTPSAGRDMGALLRRLAARRDEAGLPHQVTYEATHHGPFLSVPTLFVEVGSDDKWYRDAASARCVAAALEDVLGGEGRCGGPLYVGVGGGHYAPRATDIAKAGEADFGHLLPAHSLHGPEVLAKAVAATPGCAGLHVHHKGLNGEQRAKVAAWAAELRIPVANP